MQLDFLSTQGVDTRTKQMAQLTQERMVARFSGVWHRSVLVRIQRERLVHAGWEVEQMRRAIMERSED